MLQLIPQNEHCVIYYYQFCCFDFEFVRVTGCVAVDLGEKIPQLHITCRLESVLETQTNYPDSDWGMERGRDDITRPPKLRGIIPSFFSNFICSGAISDKFLSLLVGIQNTL